MNYSLQAILRSSLVTSGILTEMIDMRIIAVLTVALLIVGCSVNAPATPDLTGPSEFGLSVTMAAVPERLPRDGSSQSTVTVTVRDSAGRPVRGQHMGVSTNAGSVSESLIVTGDDGRAIFAFVAPPASSGLNDATISVTPVETNALNAVSRILTIALTGTPGVTSLTAPTALFTISPSAPTMGDPVSFDASTTMDEGVRCLDMCTYSWNFGDEATASGRLVTYRFRAARTYAVTLTVVDAAGSVGTSIQNVSVAQGALPTATFAFSPASPGQFEAVNFTALASTAGTGRTITSYEWRFGDGSTATGVTTSHSYNVLGTYSVQLTVTDSAGLQASATQSITIVNGVTAAFNFSPTTPTAGQEVVFNAEESRGSSNGFGGRNQITKYIWHFGRPGDTSLVETYSPRTTQSFPSAQTYRVTLTVEDGAGRRQTTNQTVAVN